MRGDKGQLVSRQSPSCVPVRRMALGVAVVGSLLLPALSRLAEAQQASLNVAARLTAEPGVRSPLAIRVGPPGTLPRNSYLRIRGLPAMASLSDGYVIAPGSWAVPIAGVDNLSVLLEANAPARSEIIVTLVSVDGAVLAEVTSTLMVAATTGSTGRTTQKEPEAKAPANVTILRAGTEPPNEPRATISGPGLRAGQAITPEDRERAQRLVQKGEGHMAEGNVAAARLMFERAADIGLADAAMALAATFDAEELTRLSVRGGIQPDAKEARRWYERALQLGARDAEPRLRRLGAN
jgi:hypothetical protein